MSISCKKYASTSTVWKKRQPFLGVGASYLPVEIGFLALNVHRVNWIQSKPGGKGKSIFVGPFSQRRQNHCLWNATIWAAWLEKEEAKKKRRCSNVIQLVASTHSYREREREGKRVRVRGGGGGYRAWSILISSWSVQMNRIIHKVADHNPDWAPFGGMQHMSIKATKVTKSQSHKVTKRNSVRQSGNEKQMNQMESQTKLNINQTIEHLYTVLFWSHTLWAHSLRVAISALQIKSHSLMQALIHNLCVKAVQSLLKYHHIGLKVSEIPKLRVTINLKVLTLSQLKSTFCS